MQVIRRIAAKLLGNLPDSERKDLPPTATPTSRSHSSLLDGESDLILRKSTQCHEILSRDYGHIASIRSGLPVDPELRPIPWITYPALEYLNRLDCSSASVFEFGSGNSTLYWASRARHVTSVESDADWHRRVLKDLPDNAECFLETNVRGYVESIRRMERSFDIIVIDGRYRYDCVEPAVSALAEGGVLVFDNSDWHPSSCSRLRSLGFNQVDFCGFGPINDYTWATSLFFKGTLRIPFLPQPWHPVGGNVVLDNPEDKSLLP